MSSFDLGKLKFAWKGDYDAAITYEKDDVVAHGGSSWVFVNDTATAGQTPSSSNTTYWDQMSQGSDLGASQTYLKATWSITMVATSSV